MTTKDLWDTNFFFKPPSDLNGSKCVPWSSVSEDYTYVTPERSGDDSRNDSGWCFLKVMFNIKHELPKVTKGYLPNIFLLLI